MRQYLMQGRVTLEGVDFFVTANSEQEAFDKVSAGQWHTYEIDAASMVDWTILRSSVEPNE